MGARMCAHASDLADRIALVAEVQLQWLLLKAQLP